jgi:hypothetical protein
LRAFDDRHATCSTEGMTKMNRDPDSSLAFLSRAIVPSASDGTLTAWSLIGLLLVVAALLMGAR